MVAAAGYSCISAYASRVYGYFGVIWYCKWCLCDFLTFSSFGGGFLFIVIPRRGDRKA